MDEIKNLFHHILILVLFQNGRKNSLLKYIEPVELEKSTSYLL